MQLLPQEVCNLKIIANFSIGKTVYKINKYMIKGLTISVCKVNFFAQRQQILSTKLIFFCIENDLLEHS